MIGIGVCVCMRMCALYVFKEALLLKIYYLSLSIEKCWIYGLVDVHINANYMLLWPYEITKDSK